MLRVFCFFLGLVAAVSGACQGDFKQVGEGCYYFSYQNGQQMNWGEARETCLRLSTEADLAVLDYLCHDYVMLANYLLAENAHLSLSPMYIGAEGYDSTWFWVDGRPLSLSSIYWYMNYPTSGSGCVYLLLSDPYSHTKVYMEESSCSSSRYFICQDNIHTRR